MNASGTGAMTDGSTLGRLGPGERCIVMNLARVDLISLKLILLCESEGTLGRAARRAHISLAGASHRLSTFERQFGAQVFRRHYRGLSPTSEGAELIDEARSLLAAVERFYARAIAPHSLRCGEHD